MTSRSSQLVSVVVPAYNAAATIDETLCSVVSQTHDLLDIIVVDDGSSDATGEIARRHADEDSRIRVIRQENAGVAAARNHGASLAHSDLLAFVDADDLWAPEKIERQLQALREGGDEVGFVYCWSATIDGHSVITDSSFRPEWQGDVLDQLFLSNFVGNGSSALVTRRAFLEARGFEPGLRVANAQGCEDYLFACRVAGKYGFALVPDHLVGYRYLPDNMSSDMAKMLRSWFLVADEMRARHPSKSALIARGLRSYAGWLVRRAIYRRQPGRLPPVFFLLWRRHPTLAAATIGNDFLQAIGHLLRGAWQRTLSQRPPAGPGKETRRFLIGSRSARSEGDANERHRDVMLR